MARGNYNKAFSSYYKRRNHLKKSLNRTKIFQCLLLFLFLLILCYYYTNDELNVKPSWSERLFMEDFKIKIENEWLKKQDERCNIPKLDPFNTKVIDYHLKRPNYFCDGFDWVRCKLSECRVRYEILQQYKNIKCIYQDLIFVSDQESFLSSEKIVKGDNAYELFDSDHVKVHCSGMTVNTPSNSLWMNRDTVKWTGLVQGFRKKVHKFKPKQGRENTINIAIVGFHSISKNDFIQRMPKSYVILVESHAFILDGYNIIGNGTLDALFPLLTGCSELELPDRRKIVSDDYLDNFPFIFQKLCEDGYRTAFFENFPPSGGFRYEHNGFKREPAHHYLRTFLLNEKQIKPDRYTENSSFSDNCVGDTPSYQFLLNASEQFLELNEKKFIFTFIADIKSNMISTVDDDFVLWLTRFLDRGHLEDTMLIVMSDHGTKQEAFQNPLIGKLEERLPLMAIILPSQLKRKFPTVPDVLRFNKGAITTAYDVHETILDAVGLLDKTDNSFKRMSLLKEIPTSRTCNMLGIEAQWCTCLTWRVLPYKDKMYDKIVQELIVFINNNTEPFRKFCVERTIHSITHVKHRSVSPELFADVKPEDNTALGISEEYTVEIVCKPDKATYEATMIYIRTNDEFKVDDRVVNFIEPESYKPCSKVIPFVQKYCYCR